MNRFNDVQGGEGPNGPWVSLVCKICGDGVAYWDHKFHGWPSLATIRMAWRDHRVTTCTGTKQ